MKNLLAIKYSLILILGTILIGLLFVTAKCESTVLITITMFIYWGIILINIISEKE